MATIFIMSLMYLEKSEYMIPLANLYQGESYLGLRILINIGRNIEKNSLNRE